MLTKWFNHPIMAREERTASRGIFRPWLRILWPRGAVRLQRQPSVDSLASGRGGERVGRRCATGRRAETDSVRRRGGTRHATY